MSTDEDEEGRCSVNVRTTKEIAGQLAGQKSRVRSYDTGAGVQRGRIGIELDRQLFEGMHSSARAAHDALEQYMNKFE